MPKCDLPIDVYIYCTKDKDILCLIDNVWHTLKVIKGKLTSKFHGKVLAKFTLNKVEEILVGEENNDYFYKTESLTNEKLRNASCLSNKELLDYLNLEQGYAWHISNLEIFDKPKELNEFWKVVETSISYELTDTKKEKPIKLNACKNLTKAPQSWQWIETGE